MSHSAAVYLQNACPLASSSLRIVITDLVAEHALVHRFRNQGSTALEAVFTFPMPLDAAFLGMEATLAGRQLSATVMPASHATRTYDRAVVEGDSSVLLQAPAPGVLCLSLGNLAAGESGEITLRFACSVPVADARARLSVPMVHRPRYGHWRLQELDTPTADFSAQHPLDIAVEVSGLLAGAPVTCPSHAAKFSQIADITRLAISAAQMDRDFVLVFDLPNTLAPIARRISDGTHSLGWVTALLPSHLAVDGPLDACLVMDCSGSMAGDAIQQSRDALRAVAKGLRGADRVQVLRFGSTVHPMFRRLLSAEPQVLETLSELAETLDANLGGTEMRSALEMALQQLGDSGEGRARAIILVTDGAVQPAEIDAAAQAAKRSGVRIFVVAVGASAAVEVLQPLAETTGAQLERATHAESIADSVMRQLRRSRHRAPIALNVSWHGGIGQPLPCQPTYPGDVLCLQSVLPVSGAINVRVVAGASGWTLDVAVPSAPQPQPALRAIVGNARLAAARASERMPLAVHYGLLSRETSAVLVSVRQAHEKLDSLPRMIKVPGMLPHGMLIAEQRARPMPSPMDVSMMDMCDDLRIDYASPVDPASTASASRLARSGGSMGVAESSSPRDARRCLTLLHDLLRAALLSDQPESITLGQLVLRLPSALQHVAATIIADLELSEDDLDAAMTLLIALEEAPDSAALNHNQQSRLAQCIARYPAGVAALRQRLESLS